MESQLPLPLTLDDASQLQPSTRTAHREEALWAAGRGTGNFLSRSFSSKKIQQLHHLNIRRNKRAIGDGFLRENRVTMAFVAGLKEENCYCGFVISVHLTYQSFKKL